MAQLIKGKQLAAQTVTINGSTGNVIAEGNLDMSTHSVILTNQPTADNQAANKAYVDAVAQGVYPHAPVLVLSEDNLDLTGLETVDGVSLSAGESVLVNGQTDLTENGIYLVSATAWTRRPDADGDPDHEVVIGDFVFVESGSTNAASGWVLGLTDATGSTINPGVNTQFWYKMAAPGSYSTDGEGIELSGSVFSLEIDPTNGGLTKSAAGIKLDATISGAISTNTANVTSLSTAVSTETSARTTADTSLSTAISTEVSATNSDVTSLSTAISTSGSGVESLSTALSSEISATNSDVTSLSTSVSTTDSTAVVLSTALSSEISATNSDVTSLSTAISSIAAPAYVENLITPANSGETTAVVVSTTAFPALAVGETVEESSIVVFLNGISYVFEYALGTPAIFHTNGTTPSTGSATTLYFDGVVAGFAIETDDSVKLKYVVSA